MEWLKKIVEKAVDTDGKININTLIEKVNIEFPKNAIPKDVFNKVNKKLKVANTTIESLQDKIKEYEILLENLEIEAKKSKGHILKSSVGQTKDNKVDFTVTIHL
jgi:hypothetical protein